MHRASYPLTFQAFYGAVTNNAGGTIENTGGMMQFLAGLINNGAYITDPADNMFDNLTVGSTGYLIGSTGDRFIVSGDFIDSSTQNALWDTGDWNSGGAQLAFLTGGAHKMSFDGTDLGPTYQGYLDNFAWGALRLRLNQTLQFIGAHGKGQYIGGLVLDGGLAELSAIQSNGLNLYYNPSDPLNAYLHGQTYQLPGGGLLEAAGVPEPATVLLIAAGLGALVLRRVQASRSRAKSDVTS